MLRIWGRLLVIEGIDLLWSLLCGPAVVVPAHVLLVLRGRSPDAIVPWLFALMLVVMFAALAIASKWRHEEWLPPEGTRSPLGRAAVTTSREGADVDPWKPEAGTRIGAPEDDAYLVGKDAQAHDSSKRLGARTPPGPKAARACATPSSSSGPMRTVRTS